MAQQVWIVCHDESPDNTVLGVFDNQEAASAMADEVGPRFENGVIYFSWFVGNRYDQSPRQTRYSTTEPDGK